MGKASRLKQERRENRKRKLRINGHALVETTDTKFTCECGKIGPVYIKDTVLTGHENHLVDVCVWEGKKQ